jgi:hypothetical protein
VQTLSRSVASCNLTPVDLAALERESWIDRETAEQFGLRRVNSPEGAALVGRDNREDYAGIVFPIYWPGKPEPRECHLRRDHPPIENGKPKQKYLAPPGRKNLLLFGPGEPAETLTNTILPIVLVEGLKKLCAASRLSRWETIEPRFLLCAISGVWNWKGTIGKTVDPSGARVDLKGIIPDIDRINWAERSVLIVYDSDALTNPNVSAAREQLAEELRSRGAHVVVMYVPPLDGLPKTGFDDLLANWGPERVLAWLKEARAQAADVQDDPEPIPLDTLDAPEFPLDELPALWFRDMIAAVSDATETPAELALLLGLAVVATAVQRRVVVEPEPGYVEPLNVFAIAALDSGNRKTAVLKEMTVPLLAFEQRQAADMANTITAAEAARRLAEDRVKHLRQRAAKASRSELDSLRQELFDEEAAIPEVPKAVRLWAQDITPEKLGVLMAEQNESMAILSDEGGLFDILAGRYSQGVPNLDVFLQAHAGAPYRVDRGSRPSVFLETPALTLALSPQPAVLKGLASQPGFRGRGFLARLLIMLPYSRLGRRTLASTPVPESIRDEYRRQVVALLTQPRRPDGHPHTLTLTAGAHREWKAFQRHVEVELRDGGMFAHIRDWASKLPGALARIAGLLHCAVYATDHPHAHPVELSTMEAALALGALLERHALTAFSLMAVDSNLDAAQKVWAWVVRQRQPTFSKRDCFQALKGSFPDMASLAPALGILVERGYVFPVPILKRAGRPSEPYRVNSRLAKGWTS